MMLELPCRGRSWHLGPSRRRPCSWLGVSHGRTLLGRHMRVYEVRTPGWCRRTRGCVWSRQRKRDQTEMSSVLLLKEPHPSFDEPEEVSFSSESLRHLFALRPDAPDAIKIWATKLEGLLVTSWSCDPRVDLPKFLQPVLGRAAEGLERKRPAVAIEWPHTLRFLGSRGIPVVDHEYLVAGLEDRDDRIATDSDSIRGSFYG